MNHLVGILGSYKIQIVAPTQPTSIIFSSITQTAFTATWSNGTGATSYTYKLNNSAVTPSTDNGVASKSARFTGLVASTPYDLIVTAINAGGPIASAIFSVTTLATITPKVLLRANNYSGSGTWNDESGNSKNATLEFGTISKNAAGNGIVLNGSTSWTFPNVAVGNAWTANVWYKNTGSQLGGNYQGVGAGACILTQILKYPTTINICIGDSLYQNNRTYQCGFYSSAFFNGITITLVNGNWTNIQATWNGTNLVTYINGAQSSTNYLAGTSQDSLLAYRIGRRWDVDDYMVGEIGEVRIYNIALTSAQVTADYNTSAPTFGSAIV